MRPHVTLLPGMLLPRSRSALEGIGSHLEPFFPFLKLQLRHADIRMSPAEYLAAVLVSGIAYGVLVFVIAFIGAVSLDISPAWLIALGLAFLFGALVMLQDLAIPQAIISRKVKSIERNLIPALSDFIVQLNSGIPLFDTMVNLANGDYGAVSSEFKRTVRRISTGENQVAVLEDLATSNPSVFFRRVVWQLVNALKTGASISKVLADAIDRLGDEQIIQIQNYGGQLNGLTMFYMLSAIIAPALLLTATVVLSFFFALTSVWTTIVFAVVELGVLFLQIMFLGLLRTRRPNLL